MSDEYLWNGAGERDPAVADLEDRLRSLRWSAAPLNAARSPRPHRTRVAWAVAVAASLAIAVSGALIYDRVAGRTSWTLLANGNKPSAVRKGQTIETSSTSGVTVSSDDLGSVVLDPNTRLRVGGATRFGLDRGTIHALIWAAPTKFVVDTPSAAAVDLGCQYTLSVGKDGNGFLSVETGWVAFEAHGLESFIPAGAACTTRRDHGPDTPRFLDAPPRLIDALVRFDSAHDSQSLDSVLQTARSRDALTLWHLLRRTKGPERDSVYSRLSQLITLPNEASREAVLRGDPKALDAAWNALQLGDTGWWREWKRRW